jgi:hypothetical protein
MLRPNSSGLLAILMAMGRASSRVRSGPFEYHLTGIASPPVGQWYDCGRNAITPNQQMPPLLTQNRWAP